MVFFLYHPHRFPILFFHPPQQAKDLALARSPFAATNSGKPKTLQQEEAPTFPRTEGLRQILIKCVVFSNDFPIELGPHLHGGLHPAEFHPSHRYPRDEEGNFGMRYAAVCGCGLCMFYHGPQTKKGALRRPIRSCRTYNVFHNLMPRSPLFNIFESYFPPTPRLR